MQTLHIIIVATISLICGDLIGYAMGHDDGRQVGFREGYNKGLKVSREE